ncbi:hypothetical protein SAMD00019534_039170 [Acytostelium subglobosum LB1]|uniref:hypothetical protein n=1 Tax=Acytostelium subglobosum LB1 TaxID=1410327 RepID=UPI0006449548|nr:hypothetical protein SAMD00019534_039170 [Acytostelium subglobosum LB1]GAM20742.1 hypothetical protein SAMD00019534_039170 [Acytostelium subglobosum LB1]|eukprot:XP_012755876.1 hypothetical protein SAMD00019534_039170 [Acytostelium subglobosum LB1]
MRKSTSGAVGVGNMITSSASPMVKTTPVVIKTVKKPMWTLDKNNIFDSDIPPLSEKAKIFLENIKIVWKEKELILNRNHNSLRHFLSKLTSTIGNMIHQGGVRDIYENVKLLVEITIKSRYFIETVRSFISMLLYLKEADESITFFLEMKKMIMIISRISQAITNETQTLEMFKIEEKQSRKLITLLKNMITFVMRSEEFVVLVKNIESLKKQVRIAKEEQDRMFPIKEKFKAIMKDAPLKQDLIQGLQSIIGEKIDMRIIVRNIREVINFAKSNKDYQNTIREFTQLVSKIYSMDELYMDDNLELHVQQLIDKLEKIIIEISSTPSIVQLRIQLSLLATSIKKDPINSKFLSDIKQLFQSCLKQVGTGNDMKMRLDIPMLREIRMMVLPLLIQRFKTIPLPKITNMDDEQRKKKIDFCLEDVNIKLTFLDPNAFQVGTITHIKTIPLALKASLALVLTLEITNVKFRIDNMKWFVKKYTIPKLKDSGLATIVTGDKGIDVRIKLAISQALFDQKHAFSIAKVACKIHDIDLTIVQSKHNGLYEKLFSLFNKKIKKALEKVLVQKIEEALSKAEMSLSNSLFNTESKKKETDTRRAQKRVNREKIMERIVTEIPRPLGTPNKGLSKSSDSVRRQKATETATGRPPSIVVEDRSKGGNDDDDFKPLTSHPTYSDNLEDIEMLKERAANHRRSSLSGRVEQNRFDRSPEAMNKFQKFLDLHPSLNDDLQEYRCDVYGIPPDQVNTNMPQIRTSTVTNDIFL